MIILFLPSSDCSAVSVGHPAILFLVFKICPVGNSRKEDWHRLSSLRWAPVACLSPSWQQSHPTEKTGGVMGFGLLLFLDQSLVADS